MAFHERWFAGPKQARLAEALTLVPLDGPGELVEVGSWEGRSTIQILTTFPDDRVHAIDHFLGDLTDPDSGVAAIAAIRDVYADFRENLVEAGVWERAVVHRAGWRDVFTDWVDPIRMLFIDGQHTYAEVADNIVQATPHLVPGAVICGDDYTIAPVAKAVHDALGQVIQHPGPGAAIWAWVAP